MTTEYHWKSRLALSQDLASARQRWFVWLAAAVIVFTWTAYVFRFRPDLLPSWLVHLLEHGLYGLVAPIKSLGVDTADGAGAVAAWGQFGDFLGGVLNPTLSFLALLAVARTLRLQALQLELSRIDQQAANTASQITALHSATEVLTRQIEQMQDVSNRAGLVSPELYQSTLNRRDELTRQMLKLSESLLPKKA